VKLLCVVFKGVWVSPRIYLYW